MLTPKFSLSQDADFIYIHIIAPYIKLKETECYINDDEFYFYSQPYYLRLHLPSTILENHLSTSQYDANSGQLTVRVAKERKGEFFEGLDMLSKLLTPKNAKKDNGEIEVIGTSEKSADYENDVDDDVELDWFIEQTLEETPSNILLSGPRYGFAQRKSNVLNALLTSFPDLLDLKEPDSVPVNKRRFLREQQETELFSCEHYLADLFDDDTIQEVISKDYPELTGKVGEETVFTEMEKDKLLQLPRREYIIDNSDLKSVYLGLVDIVFSYAYNFRFSNGESNVESDWTVCKLSAILSWLDIFENIHDVVISCARRSLSFPLYRNWNLFLRVFSDVKTIFLAGKSQVLKCLLGIYEVLAKSDNRYPLNELYISDYCVWLQGSDSKKIKDLAKALVEVKITKSDVGLRLDEMEKDAREFMDSFDDDEKVDDCGKKEGDVEKLADALADIVTVKDSVVDSDDDYENDDVENGGSGTECDDSNDPDDSSNESDNSNDTDDSSNESDNSNDTDDSSNESDNNNDPDGSSNESDDSNYTGGSSKESDDTHDEANNTSKSNDKSVIKEDRCASNNNNCNIKTDEENKFSDNQ